MNLISSKYKTYTASAIYSNRLNSFRPEQKNRAWRRAQRQYYTTGDQYIIDQASREAEKRKYRLASSGYDIVGDGLIEYLRYK